ncbi:BRA0787 family protein [Oryzicola mucosus]|uniref:Uncharacterized protein n=1 Tax=Oryzicola mucosus TaxID=2767425 RepID=A0A8J6U1R6_9HYPH|nr:hypothetical protein [Oryzicola mucosus]MBD0414793.1 hypothetical protein [Oryzicola mucosus]
MNRLLPPLHEGHAPIFLHQAFEDALEAFEAWHPGTSEPLVEFEERRVPISSVFGRMRSCTDTLPLRIADHVGALLGSEAGPLLDSGQATYAEAAILLRAMAVERLRNS